MQVAYVIFWWLALVLIGLISFPLVSRMCGGLEDKGYSVSKIVGLIFLTFISWMLSSLHILPFGYANIAVSIIILAAFSFISGRGNLKIMQWPRRSIIISEAVFAGAFLIFLLVQLGKPDIYYTGFADAVFNHAFIESILRSGYMPPADPWYAGGSIPYYYGGHYLISLLTKFTGVPASIAFNISVAMFAALAVCVCYGLGYNITRRHLYGFVAALFVCIAGYISGFIQLMAYATNHTVLGYTPIVSQNIIDWMQNFDFWTAPWIVNGAIAHYPYLSFIIGDLHSYTMSIPFQLGYIFLIYALFQKSRSHTSLHRFDTFLVIAVLSVCVGFFFILNTWEFPTYVILTFAAFIILKIRPKIRENLFIPLIVSALGFILYLPYYLSGRMSGFTGFGLLPSGLRTSLPEFLEFCGPFLLIIAAFMLVFWKRDSYAGRRAVIVSVIILVPTILLAYFLHFHILVLVIPIGLLSLYFLYKSEVKTAREFVFLLIIVAMALAFFCDFIYINDALSGEWVRFNTILKLYHSLWIFLGIAAAYALYAVSCRFSDKGRLARASKFTWIGIVSILIAVSLLHPIASTVSMTSGRHEYFSGINKGTLDGMAYLEIVSEDDYEAIKWMKEEIKGLPVILEMPGNPGSYSSRVSAFTGLPTVIGWQMWQIMWRTEGNNVYERSDDVDLIYNTLDNEEALLLLSKYDVKYIYIGSVERDKYAAEGLQKFDDFVDIYELIYENEGVSIYRLKED